MEMPLSELLDVELLDGSELLELDWAFAAMAKRKPYGRIFEYNIFAVSTRGCFPSLTHSCACSYPRKILKANPVVPSYSNRRRSGNKRRAYAGEG